MSRQVTFHPSTLLKVRAHSTSRRPKGSASKARPPLHWFMSTTATAAVMKGYSPGGGITSGTYPTEATCYMTGSCATSREVHLKEADRTLHAMTLPSLLRQDLSRYHTECISQTLPDHGRVRECHFSTSPGREEAWALPTS